MSLDRTRSATVVLSAFLAVLEKCITLGAHKRYLAKLASLPELSKTSTPPVRKTLGSDAYASSLLEMRSCFLVC